MVTSIPRPLLAALAASLGLVTVVALAVPPAADAQVPFAEADFSASSTGTVLHADALESDGSRVENAELAFSGASVDSGGLADRSLNEVGREVQPPLPDKRSHARGSGLEVGFGVTPDDPNQVILAGLATQSAPPNGDPVTEQYGPLEGDPLAWASVLRGQARARWSDATCLLGDDISRGVGYAEDAQLLDAGEDAAEEGLDEPAVATDADGPARAVSQSLSRTLMVAQSGGPNFGLAAESRQTIAPVTFFKNTDDELTIEFLGEWVLRVVATGLAGGAKVHYGPGTVSPETPILRTIDADGTVTNSLTAGQFFGDGGLVVTIPGVAELAIGEDPRAIGGDATTEPLEAADGTQAAGAVDVVRVKLLEQVEGDTVTARAAQVRVGHMESRVQVPPGGIACSLPVDKTAEPPTTTVDTPFTTPITVHNPFDCDLVNVRVQDDITTAQGATFTIRSTDPPADAGPTGTDLSSGTIVWDDIGPIPPGESRTVRVTINPTDAGRIDDIATASGTLANCRGEGAAVEGVALAAAGAGVTGVSPAVRVPVSEVLGQALPRTGAATAATVAAGLVLVLLSGSAATWNRRPSR
jgi:hypothetical protein